MIGYDPIVDASLYLKMLANPRASVVNFGEQGLRELCRIDPSQRAQVATEVASLPSAVRVSVYSALQPLLASELTLVDQAVEDVVHGESDVARAALGAVRNLVADRADVRRAVIGRFDDPDSIVVAMAVDALRQAAHLDEIRHAMEPLLEHTSEDVCRVTAQVLSEPLTIERGLDLPERHEPTQQSRSLYVVADPTERSEAIATVEDARDAVQSLLEFCSEDQREAVEAIVEAEILPALSKVRELLATEATDDASLRQSRSESASLANRAGGLMRGVASGLGSKSVKVYAVIELGERIYNLIPF